MAKIHVAQLLEGAGEATSGWGQGVVHARGKPLEFLSTEQAETDQSAKALVENLGRDTRYESLEGPGALDALGNGGDDRGTPFAADHVLKAVVSTALG